MVMEVDEHFSLNAKGESDKNNVLVQKWESLMEQSQQLLPGTPEGEKWVKMNRIFKL
ncbi:MAG: L-rhamnose mutarotase [Maribacter arcticus]